MVLECSKSYRIWPDFIVFNSLVAESMGAKVRSYRNISGQVSLTLQKTFLAVTTIVECSFNLFLLKMLASIRHAFLRDHHVEATTVRQYCCRLSFSSCSNWIFGSVLERYPIHLANCAEMELIPSSCDQYKTCWQRNFLLFFRLRRTSAGRLSLLC